MDDAWFNSNDTQVYIPYMLNVKKKSSKVEEDLIPKDESVGQLGILYSLN